MTGKRHNLSTVAITNICNDYKAGISIRNLEKKYKIGRTTIGLHLKNNNVVRKPTGNSYKLRKYTLDERYFQKIDTPDKAYWLGFINADGHVWDDGLVIGLAAKDLTHLELFKTKIKSNHKIRYIKNTNANVMSLYSRALVQDLRNLGLQKQKSKTQIFPKIDSHLNNSLIRGLLDGDGSITKRSSKYRPGFSVNFSGTYETMFRIKEIVCEELEVSKSKIIEVKNNFCTLTWGGNFQSEKILDWIYKDSSAENRLSRKYSRYLELIEQNKIPSKSHKHRIKI